jgi:hypothetical protein
MQEEAARGNFGEEGRGVRHGHSRELSPKCVLWCSSAIVEEGAIFRIAKG